MARWLVCSFVVLLLMAMVSACVLPTSGTHDAAQNGNPISREVDFPPAGTTTPVHTPTVMTEKGKGEIVFSRVFAMEDANKGEMLSSINETIPFTISYSGTKSVWEVKGSHLGVGTMEYHATKPSKVDCSGTWGAELSLFGDLVPFNALIADKDGCSIQISTVEDWEKISASCSTHLGTAGGLFEENYLYSYPTVKLNLIEGDQANQILSQVGFIQNTSWKIQNLDVPLATGCIVP